MCRVGSFEDGNRASQASWPTCRSSLSFCSREMWSRASRSSCLSPGTCAASAAFTCSPQAVPPRILYVFKEPLQDNFVSFLPHQTSNTDHKQHRFTRHTSTGGLLSMSGACRCPHREWQRIEHSNAQTGAQTSSNIKIELCRAEGSCDKT